MLPSRIFSQAFLPRNAPPEMDDAVAPLHHALDRFHVGNVGLVNLLAVSHLPRSAPGRTGARLDRHRAVFRAGHGRYARPPP